MTIANVKVGSVFACAAGCNQITSGMIGVTVTFEYTDSMWDGLNKTAVFTAGRVTRDVPNAGEVVTVPAEVLARPREKFYVGVYGTDADGNLAIPTVMTFVGVILPGADPSGDPGTDPDLPIWAQLEERVSDLEQNGTGGASVTYDETTGELTITGSGVTYNEDTGELKI